jgi:hypothetical protein
MWRVMPELRGDTIVQGWCPLGAAGSGLRNYVTERSGSGGSTANQVLDLTSQSLTGNVQSTLDGSDGSVEINAHFD